MGKRFDTEGECDKKHDFHKVCLGLTAEDLHVHECVVKANDLNNELQVAAEVGEAHSEKHKSPEPHLGLAAGNPHIYECAWEGEISENVARCLPIPHTHRHTGSRDND